LLFFSNLTTRVADVAIQLHRRPVTRNILKKNLGFTEIKKYYDDILKELGGPKKTKGKGKPMTQEELDELYEKALSGAINIDVLTIDKKMHPAERLIRSLGWEPVHFVYEWGSNKSLMGLSYKQSHRSAKRRGERMLVMSGQEWNKASKDTDRDWPNIATAMTFETAIVESYRGDLVMSCSGVCALRKEMEVFFLSVASSYFHSHPTTGDAEKRLEWSFPDGIESSVGPSQPKSYDPDQQRKDLLKANPTAGMMAKNKRNTMIFTVETLEKNPFLWCSDPDVPHGTVETLARHCIDALAQVR
jgi:hypothetical protein